MKYQSVVSETIVLVFSVATLFFTVDAPAANAQAHERHEQERAASAEIKAVSGGTTFNISAPFDKVFSEIVRYINTNGLTVNKADKDTGFIGTELEISKGHHQTGTNYQVIVIKTDDSHTTLRAAVLTRKRYNFLQPDPLDDPKVDDKQTADFATKLKTALGPIQTSASE
jgi:hypothetical protein